MRQLAASLVFTLCVFYTSADPFPAVTNIQYVSLSPTSIVLAWDWEGNGTDISEVTFKVDIIDIASNAFDNTYVGVKNVTIENLVKNTEYALTITASKGNETSDEEPFVVKTLAEDWPTPSEIQEILVSRGETQAAYRLGWQVDNTKLSSLNITICDPQSCVQKVEDANSTTSDLAVNYFTNYHVTVTAIFQQPLNIVITRAQNVSFKSVMGTPGLVQNFTVEQTKYSTEFRLNWAPLVFNEGEISYYKIEVQDGQTSNTLLTYNDSLSENVNLNCPLAESYNFLISAVCEDASGNAMSLHLNLEKPERPSSIEVTERLTNSVSFRVPSESDQLIAKFGVRDINELSADRRFTVDKLGAFEKFSINASLCFKAEEEFVCGDSLTINTSSNVGRPSKVINLNVTFEENVPQVSWEKPETPEGPVDGYDIAIQTIQSTNITHQDTTGTNSTLNEQCEKFNVTVTAYNRNLDSPNTKIFGLPAIFEASPNCPQGFPIWAVVLIVVSVLSGVGAGLFYFYKKRQNSF